MRGPRAPPPSALSRGSNTTPPTRVRGGRDAPLVALGAEAPEPLAILQGAGDEAVYFAPDLRVDRLDDFFFRRAASAPSVGTRTGRSAQIRSLSSRSCWTRARKC